MRKDFYVQNDPNMDWDHYDLLCATLPEKIVFFRDLNNRPDNWDDNAFGPWFPRRLVMTNIPSLHVSQQG